LILSKSIPLSILPEEYGGDAGPIQVISDAHMKYMLENEAYFNYLNFLSMDDETVISTDTIETKALNEQVPEEQ